MLDYIASKTARDEHEQRVRSFVPVQGHDVRLTDDRQLTVWPVRSGIVCNVTAQSNWLKQQVGRLLDKLGSELIATGEWMRQKRV
jgi:hypothetical protein